ncbi:MAG: hypothetical protein IJI54_12550, partial [Kiritimatiellae bacterium]|nr:hypothetical protein [Kiritimatiellia bacterium]
MPKQPLDSALLRKKLAIPDGTEKPVITVRTFEEAQAGWLDTEEDIRIPFIYLKAAETPSETLCILSHEDGMLSLLESGREKDIFLSSGIDLLLFDPRGIGLTRGPGHGWWAGLAKIHLKALNDEGALPYSVLGYVDPSYEGMYATSNEIAMHGIKLNRPVLGQRVLDTKTVLDHIFSVVHHPYKKISIYGSGYSAVW